MIKNNLSLRGYKKLVFIERHYPHTLTSWDWNKTSSINDRIQLKKTRHPIKNVRKRINCTAQCFWSFLSLKQQDSKIFEPISLKACGNTSSCSCVLCVFDSLNEDISFYYFFTMQFTQQEISTIQIAGLSSLSYCLCQALVLYHFHYTSYPVKVHPSHRTEYWTL